MNSPATMGCSRGPPASGILIGTCLYVYHRRVLETAHHVFQAPQSADHPCCTCVQIPCRPGHLRGWRPQLRLGRLVCIWTTSPTYKIASDALFLGLGVLPSITQLPTHPIQPEPASLLTQARGQLYLSKMRAYSALLVSLD